VLEDGAGLPVFAFFAHPHAVERDPGALPGGSQYVFGQGTWWACTQTQAPGCTPVLLRIASCSFTGLGLLPCAPPGSGRWPGG
jgi:hypothetical protein